MPINKADIRASFSVEQSGSNIFGGPNFAADFMQALSFVNGVGIGQADIAYVAERTVASGANDDIDLAGVLSDALGAAIAAAELVAIFIVNRQKDGTANTTNLTLGGGTNPVVGYMGGTSPTLGPIRPNGIRLLAESDAAGLCAVTAGTGDILRVTNSAGASAKYLIAILARSA